MSSFSEFHKKAHVAKQNVTRDQFYRNEIYKKGEWVLTEDGKVGKILRRGPNYVLCLTAEETTFRSWIKDIKEVFEFGTDAYREYLQSITPGEKKQPFSKIKVKQTIPTDPKKDKMENNEYVLSAVNALNHKESWRYDKSAKMANRDPKGLGAEGVGGGDAPGMKMAEAPGTEGKPKIKKVKHSCATKVEHSEWGTGNCLKEMHTLDEQGNITHYDVMFEHGLEQNVAVQSLNVLEEGMHEHVINTDKNAEIIDEKKKLDPVGKEDGDVDNDGDKDSSDSYLMNRRRAVAKAMGKKMKKEHHQKDADGKVIEHEGEELEEKKGLYANIHAKRKRGEAPAKPGDEDYPAKDAFKKAAKTAKKEEVDLEEGDGLYANIHAKRKRGERMRSKGDKGAPTAQDFKDAAKTAKKEEVTTEGSMKQARKNVGASTCWDGYKAKGTKTKNGRQVPNCVKEDEVEEGYGAKKKKMKKENTFSNWRQEIAEKK